MSYVSLIYVLGSGSRAFIAQSEHIHCILQRINLSFISDFEHLFVWEIYYLFLLLWNLTIF